MSREGGTMTDRNLLEISRLTKYFPIKSGGRTSYIHAVEDVSFSIQKGETFGLVGESGCGKSTLGRTILRLYRPTSGTIVYEGKTIYSSETGVNVPVMPYRRKMQIIFQDPAASLDPRMTIGEAVGEALDIHRIAANRKDRWERVIHLLNRVGITEEQANRYPHEFSGGQQQRVGIARALAVEPQFIVCDEPISALDVSIQSQIVNMLEDMQNELGLTYLFIAHDISVVRHISNRIGVMYLGELIEIAESYEICRYPLHPYTKILISAVPIPDPDAAKERKQVYMSDREIASPIDPKPGCRFAARCPHANEKCRKIAPRLREVAPGHSVACHLYNRF